MIDGGISQPKMIEQMVKVFGSKDMESYYAIE